MIGPMTPAGNDLEEMGAAGGAPATPPRSEDGISWERSVSWDLTMNGEDDGEDGILRVDLGFEDLEDSVMDDMPDIRARVYAPSVPSTLENGDVRELDRWRRVATDLADEADGQGGEGEFDLWLRNRYRHDAARHVIGRLVQDVVYLRRGTFREMWTLPARPARMEPFGDLRWFPTTRMSPEEDAVWAEYSDLLNGLDIMRTHGAPLAAMRVLDERIDRVVAIMDAYMERHRREYRRDVNRRAREYAVLLALDARRERAERLARRKEVEEREREEELRRTEVEEREREEEVKRSEEEQAQQRERMREEDEADRTAEIGPAVATVAVLVGGLGAQDPEEEEEMGDVIYID